MKKMFVLAVMALLLSAGTVHSTTRVSLQDGTGLELGNEANPVIVTMAGVVVDSLGDGPVGIGSTAPRAALDVNGNVYATGFIGPVTGNVTGNASGTAATVTGAAQTSITSLGNLSALNVTGNVGVGTTVPGVQFAVGTTSQFKVTSAGVTTVPSLYSVGNVGVGSSVPQRALDVGAGSIQAASFYVGENVGVGSTSPAGCPCTRWEGGMCTALGTCS